MNRKFNSEKPEKPVALTDDQIKNTISFLNHSFRETSEDFKRRTSSYSNVKGSVLYQYQTDFAYIIDKIQRGPVFFAIQNIAEANELIGKLSRQHNNQ
jgi:hypothetical protein